ncbi:hypothetical protein GA0115252_16475 [Streptomyces sp. DfronAA-171]|nr:hypothetical protein GA0115252_16475 [Streptomyces sp. DfronAA-171]
MKTSKLAAWESAGLSPAERRRHRIPAAIPARGPAWRRASEAVKAAVRSQARTARSRGPRSVVSPVRAKDAW